MMLLIFDDFWVQFRFDDTNPEAEKQEYIDHIKDIVRWMGWEPFKVVPLFIHACIKVQTTVNFHPI